MRISIVIRAYNEERHIGRLLEGISRQSVNALETILVDSGSTDATLSIAARYQVRILQIDPQDFTFGRSLNIGCRAAKGDVIAIASAHVYPTYADWLEQLVEPFKDEDVALVYGKQRGNSTTKYSEHQHFLKMFPDHSRLQTDDPLCNNANAAIRRSLWEQHPYDDSLPGLEDIAWATWAIANGLKLVYAAGAEVIHVHDETPKQVYNRYRREAMALKKIQPASDFHLWDFVRLFASNALNDASVAARQGVLRRELGSILGFRWMQFWGTYRGFRMAGPLTRSLKETFYYPSRTGGHRVPASRDLPPIDYGAPGESDEDENGPSAVLDGAKER